jgi:glycosyltransferase involved in cell wall biosynthesis
MLAIHTPGGIGRYARILGATLLTRFTGDLHLFLATKDDLPSILSELPAHEAGSFSLRENVHIHSSRMPGVPRHLIHKLELGRVMASQKLDAYLDPDYILPDILGVPCSCVVHDTTPYTSPQMLGPKARIIYGFGAKAALRKAHRLICVSEVGKERLAGLFPEYADKLRLVESCLAPKFSNASAEAYRPQSSIRIRTSLGDIELPQPFILHVGVHGPRKNLDMLQGAFAELKLRMFPHRLVLVGGQAKPIPRTQLHVPSAALPDGSTMQQQAPLPDILHLGRVSDDDLVALYRHADLLVLPSFEEGFGYPVLEALSFRTPALVTAGSPLAHLAGVAQFRDVRKMAEIAADLEDTLRHLPALAGAITSGFSLQHYCCGRYLEDLLDALNA